MTQKGNATTATIWRHDRQRPGGDNQLMTKASQDTIPAYRRHRQRRRTTIDVLAPAKLFCPYNGWRWYITEWGAPRSA